MLRHQTIAVALFLSAGCEMAGAPAPEKPAPAASAPAATATAATAPEASADAAPSLPPAPVQSLDLRTSVGATEADEPRPALMLRGGPKWGKERPRFKLATPAPSK